LFLPKNATPPYQTIVYFPGADAEVLRSSRSAADHGGVRDPRRPPLFPAQGHLERGVQLSGANGFAI
jgi:hypothetical protein